MSILVGQVKIYGPGQYAHSLQIIVIREGNYYFKKLLVCL
jgi:hypothetical protein